MANYKVVIMIKEEDKKIHLAVSQNNEKLVKFKTVEIDEDYKQVITDIIATYPTELEEFKKQEVKTNPVKLKETKSKAKAKEEPKKENDLFREPKKEEEQKVEKMGQDKAETGTKESKTGTEETAEDADLMDMMEEE